MSYLPSVGEAHEPCQRTGSGGHLRTIAPIQRSRTGTWPASGPTSQVYERLSRLRTRVESGTVAKRNGATRNSSGPRARSRRHRGSRTPGWQLERTEAQRLADIGWIEWGGELIWVAGYTSGGAPYGLRVCDFDRADLEAMGLDVEALDDVGLLATASSSTEEPHDRLGNDDVPF
jgi:hypothetical protein